MKEPKDEWSIPRVSPYRLATHLASAFLIYAILLYTTLTYVYNDKLLPIRYDMKYNSRK